MQNMAFRMFSVPKQMYFCQNRTQKYSLGLNSGKRQAQGGPNSMNKPKFGATFDNFLFGG